MMQEGQEAEGYTLLEMIAVLGLMAMVISVSLPSTLNGMTGRSLASQAKIVALMLKSVRSVAVYQNAEKVLEVDLDARRITAPGVSQLTVDGNVSLLMLTARKEVQNTKGAIRFFPDGSSTGGTIRLQNGNRAVAVHVNWLTGRVSQEAIHDAQQ